MRLNKYLFNRVNNKERKRGQRSVVWLKRGHPCLHHLHVLSTVFLWRPFSSFSLWIIIFQKQKKARAEGYEEGDYTLFRSATVSEFLQTQHPLEVLSAVNEVGCLCTCLQ